MMLFFIYHGSYSVTGTESTPMVTHAKLFSAADRFMAAKLKFYAKAQFQAAVDTGKWTSEEFSEVITVVYTTTPYMIRGLRDIVVRASCDRIQTLSSNAAFKTMLRQPITVDFAADLSEALADTVIKTSVTKTYRCPSCSKTMTVAAAVTIGAYRHCFNCGRSRNDWLNQIAR